MTKINSNKVRKGTSKLKKISLRKTKNKQSKLRKSSKTVSKKHKKPIADDDLSENNSFTEDDQYGDEEEPKLDDEMNSAESSGDESAEDEAAKHKKDLEKLKVSDPEFYKFLQENDKKLLQFNVSDDEEDDTEQTEDVHIPSENLDVASDESDFEVSINIEVIYF